MKQAKDGTGSAGVSATRAAAHPGTLNVGGVPCEVVYREPSGGPTAVHTVPWRPDASGSFQWDPTVAGEPLSGATRPSRERALARREVASLPLVQLEGSTDLQVKPPHGGDLEKIQRLLRGRYRLACVLAVVLAAGGVWAGLHLGSKMFQSTGVVTITPIHLFQNKDASQSIEQFMLAQAAKFKSQRVLDMALDAPDWRTLLLDRNDELEATFAKELEVTPQGNMLLVRFADRDSQIATTAVKTCMDAFKKQFSKEQGINDDYLMQRWNDGAQELSRRLSGVQTQIDDIAGIYGADGLELRRDFKLQELRDVEAGLNALELTRMQISFAPEGKPAGPTTPATHMPIDEIAKVDGLIQSLMGQQTQLKQQIAEMSAGGALEKYPRLEHTKAQLAMVEEEIGSRAEDWRQTHFVSNGTITAAAGPVTTTLSPEEMKARSAYLANRRTALNNELTQLKEQIGKISDLRIKRDRYLKDFNIAEEELQQEQIEKTKWLVDTSEADRPLGPYRDTRITFAGIGGLGGVAVSFGLAMLLGVLDRRVRDPRDAVGPLSGATILGMLPQLPDDLSDPEEAAIAAHSVHEIRTLLQILGRGQNHQVFGITSASPGSGKTSLTLALGISFAAAKFKTLMIDCDLVGAGLSCRVDAIVRRRIGKILSRSGHITEAQLQHALKLAHGSGRRLGEMLVELGYLTEADLGAAIASQADQPVGLLDALAGEPVEECVAETGMPNVWVLPAGSATARDAGTLSPDSLRSVIEVARALFDVVLIDTGPIPGSLEASITASQVDAVVMTVARGDRGPDLQRSLSQLRSLGTRMAGMVFNRARKQDVERYGSGRRSSSSRSEGLPAARVATPVPDSSSERFGPVAKAVASFSAADQRSTNAPAN